MQVPVGPKGTRDFYPEDMALREAIFSSWRNTCARYAFEPYDAPTFEHLELYTQKSGEEIEKQLYVFEDKAQRRLALRPELTPSLARMVAAKGNTLKRPVRWYSIPRLYRYEKMQKGRLREFFQLNMDILGIPDLSADAELIAASIDMMRDLEFTSDDFSVLISSRSLLEEMFLSMGIPKDKLLLLYAVLDKRHKIPPDAFDAELAAVVSPSASAGAIRDALAVTSLSDLSRLAGNLPSIITLQQLLASIDAYGLAEYAAFDIGVVRGLAYYTGIVFELFDKKRSLRAIAGGGRYDKLVKLYGGPDTPAVGFAAGDVVLGEMLGERKFSVPSSRSSVFIASLNESGHPLGAIRVATVLRNAGISCEFSLKKTGIGKQMEQAHAARSAFAVIIGGEEEKQGQVKVRNMRSGEESLVPRENLAVWLNAALKAR
ncbi:MAG TPA: histidine--tRNA ligase [Chitinivibrionales bacterium]|nr:histidine--tRNA ligase [Chitinivibrionales bacterium]